MSRGFPLSALAAPLAADEIAALSRLLTALLEWHETLSGWPQLADVCDATPIVSLYRAGGLAGCAGMLEGRPGERVARAFLAAAADLRFGGLDARARAELVAQVSFAIAPERVDPSHATSVLEAGVHGACLVPIDAQPATLLPDVARDLHLEADAFLDALAHKAGVPRARWPRDGLWLFETERVIVRRGALETAAPNGDRLAAAVGWLANRVERSGQIGFGLDPRSGAPAQPGPMWHGRAAIVLRALDAHPAGAAAAERARRWLTRETRDAVLGRSVNGWPSEPALQAGTLALAALAGIDVGESLHAFARSDALHGAPWYAAQVVAALGEAAPASLFQRCVDDLERDAWAPWTALAASRLQARPAFERAIAGLVGAVRAQRPHHGGVGVAGAAPELARTAASVEALVLSDDAEAARAVARAGAFIERHQLTAANYPLARDPASAMGAFPVSPVRDYLQTDVTAHAVLALSARVQPG